MEAEIPKEWAAHFRRSAAKVNFAIWLDACLKVCLGVALAGALLVLLMRSMGTKGIILALVPALGILLAALVPIFTARRRFWDASDARTRLDVTLPFQTRLSAAAEGATAWPQVPAEVDDRFRFAWRRLLPAPLIAAALLVIAFLVPVGGSTKGPAVPASQPRSWAAMEEALAAIEQTQVTQPEPIEQFREELKRLQQTDPQKWFSHDSLEASDNLEARLRSSAQTLKQGLFNAANALDQASEAREGSETQGEFRDAAKALNQSAAGLLAGNLPIDKKMADALQKLGNPGAWKNMEPNQLQQLKQQLQQGVQGADKCLANLPGDNPGEKGGQPGPGNGGVDRGPGHFGLSIGPPTQAPDPTISAPLDNPDMSRAAMGDLLEVQRTAPQEESEDPSQLQSDGSLGTSGTGGDAVLRPEVSPAENAILQRYFK